MLRKKVFVKGMPSGLVIIKEDIMFIGSGETSAGKVDTHERLYQEKR